MKSDLIAELNHLLAEEVEASLRYLHLTIALEPQDAAVLKMFQDARDETIEHAEQVGAKIRALGGVPRIEIRMSCPNGPISVPDAIAEVLTFEEAALEGYQELLESVLHGGAADADLVEFLRSQVKLESEHVEQFRRLAGA